MTAVPAPPQRTLRRPHATPASRPSSGSPTQGAFDDLVEFTARPLRELTFVVVDLETTGGSPASCEITEIGAVKIRAGEVVGEFATLINPGTEISAFITPRALITVRKDDGFDPGTLVGRWDASPDLAAHGVGFLVHGLLDQIVDGHFAAVQSLDDEIEELQDQLFAEADPSQNLQRRSFELRKSLVLLRRVVLPMREVVNTIMRRDLHLLDEALTPYYQDVYDHVLRATEWTESLRDLVTTILETRLTIQGNRLNEIMRKLTCWAAIIACIWNVPGRTRRMALPSIRFASVISARFQLLRS